MKILALDPGGTTGWATATIVERDYTALGGPILDDVRWQQGMLGPQEHHKQLWGLMELQETEHDFRVVCESFEFRNEHRDGLVIVSSEYIGLAKLFQLQRHPDHPVVLQTASTGKIRPAKTEATAFVKKRNLQALGLWNLGPKSEHHMVDATGHLLYYMLAKPGIIPAQLRMDLLIKGGWK